MKPTRALAVIAAAGMSVALSGCGGSTGNSGGGSSSSGGGDCSSDETFCIGLVTDAGKIDDKSFNQSAWEGVKAAAKETNAKTKYLQPSSPKDYASSIKQFADAKYDVIVTVGFNIAKDTTSAAKTFPDVKFIGIDQAQTATVDNVTGLIFPEDKAGYAAGYLGGLLTKTNKVGQVLGEKIPPVEKYAKGYIAGAKAANPKVAVQTVYHPTGNGFNDPVWGGNEAKRQLAQGADVVFGAGGNTGNGALSQVAKASGAGTKIYCIGVDTDQWTTVPSARKCLVTSALKEITKGTTDLLAQAKDGSIKGGDFIGTTGLAPYHDFDSKIPADVKTKVETVVKGLESGSVKTGVKLG